MQNLTYDEKTICEELEKIKECIRKNEKRFSKLDNKQKNRSEYENICEDVMCILFYLGELSESEDMRDVREMYEMASRLEYPNNPKKANKLFLKNYTKHTERFDILKERCWKMVEKISVLLNKR